MFNSFMYMYIYYVLCIFMFNSLMYMFIRLILYAAYMFCLSNQNSIEICLKHLVIYLLIFLLAISFLLIRRH